MATTSWKTAGSGSSVSRTGGVAWQDPGNITADDTSTAYNNVSSGKGPYTEYLYASNFGFDTGDIPDGSTIDGVEYRTTGYAANGSHTVETVQLFFGSSLQGDDKATGSWGSSEETNTYGGSSDDWNSSIDDNDARTSTTGVYLAFEATSETGTDFHVDFVELRYHYTEAVTESTLTGDLEGQDSVVDGDLEVIESASGMLNSGAASLSGSLEAGWGLAGVLEASSASVVGFVPEPFYAFTGNLDAAAATISATLVVSQEATGGLNAVAANLSGMLELQYDLIASLATQDAAISDALLVVSQEAIGTLAAASSEIEAMIVAAWILTGTLSAGSSSIAGTLAVAWDLTGELEVAAATVAGSQVANEYVLSGSLGAQGAVILGRNRFIDRHPGTSVIYTDKAPTATDFYVDKAPTATDFYSDKVA